MYQVMGPMKRSLNKEQSVPDGGHLALKIQLHALFAEISQSITNSWTLTFCKIDNDFDKNKKFENNLRITKENSLGFSRCIIRIAFRSCMSWKNVLSSSKNLTAIQTDFEVHLIEIFKKREIHEVFKYVVVTWRLVTSSLPVCVFRD